MGRNPRISLILACILGSLWPGGWSFLALPGDDPAQGERTGVVAIARHFGIRGVHKPPLQLDDQALPTDDLPDPEDGDHRLTVAEGPGVAAHAMLRAPLLRQIERNAVREPASLGLLSPMRLRC